MRDFEWDDGKAASNLAKHRVSFEEAESVFTDPLARVDDDPDHSIEERRYLIVGHSTAGRLLLVSFADRDETIRIINARRTDREERERYEEDIL